MKTEIKIYPKPTEPGFYWARETESYKWYNLIVEIYGEVPYLRYRAWNLTDHTLSSASNPPFFFGPKIETYEVERCPV